MEQQNINSWATVLNKARLEAAPIQQISTQISLFPRSAAYAIQKQQFLAREQAGEKLIGWKMGLTSEAKRKQMNLDSPLYGFLTDRMQVAHQGLFSLKGTIHPKIEPEIAFRFKSPLRGQVTRAQVLEACSGVAAALEILDSRYEQFKYFSMEDVIADNSSSSHFVIGEWIQPNTPIDLKNLKMQMFCDQQLVESGLSSDISGDPLISVIELCQLLHEQKMAIEPGQIVLAGAATPALALKANMHISLTVDQLPPTSVRIQA